MDSDTVLDFSLQSKLSRHGGQLRLLHNCDGCELMRFTKASGIKFLLSYATTSYISTKNQKNVDRNVHNIELNRSDFPHCNEYDEYLGYASNSNTHR